MEKQQYVRLRDLREDAELKQSTVAKLLGIEQTVYSRYERGKQYIPIVHLLKLAEFYGTTTDYLLGRTNYRHIPQEMKPIIPAAEKESD